ncbi:MAG TPA: efflux RND transporter periplasmic adaptor subunit [Chthoniobacterales bacterium]|nr:efflux RND transporter periplasmic adaptor subunit [Chthoniobacterales bacterium]
MIESKVQPNEPTQTSPASRKFKRLKLILLLAAIGFACVIILGLTSRAANTKAFQQISNHTAQIRVQVVFPRRSAASLELQLPGQTEAFYEAPIFAQTNGYLKTWNYDIGAKVKAGDILGEIDTPEVDQQLSQAQANLAQAKAQLDLAAVTFRRFQDLVERKVIALQDFDTQHANYLAQQATVNADAAAVRQLEALENFKLLRAPFDGVVTSRNTDIGALINSGSGNALFRVAEVNPLRVYVSVPENFGKEVHAGTDADLSFDEFPGRHFPATVVTTSSAIDPTTRTLLTELQVPNRSNELWPGAYAVVHFHLTNTGKSVLIPANTLLFRAEGPAVGVVGAGGKVEIRMVQIGTDLGTELEIVGGLSPTDQLIVNPSDSLNDGMQVYIQKTNLSSGSIAHN